MLRCLRTFLVDGKAIHSTVVSNAVKIRTLLGFIIFDCILTARCVIILLLLLHIALLRSSCNKSTMLRLLSLDFSYFP